MQTLLLAVEACDERIQGPSYEKVELFKRLEALGKSQRNYLYEPVAHFLHKNTKLLQRKFAISFI